ncbi:MAG: GNAT family N-acetyltransferase [Candidatus Sifarchaeia archaeon]
MRQKIEINYGTTSKLEELTSSSSSMSTFRIFPKTRFWLASNREQIKGAMYYNEAQTLRIFGSPDAVEVFLEDINITPKYISLQDESLDILARFVESERKRLMMYRLVMSKKELLVSSAHNIRKLEKQDLQNAFAVFRAAESEDWGTTDSVNLPFDDNNRWYGLEKNGVLVSVCWNQVYAHGGHVAFIATHPEFQNQGFASSLLKYALSDNFRRNDFSVIHVREDNGPALHCYEKIGYRKHFRFSTLVEPRMKS